MSDDLVQQILQDPRIQGQPITWDVTPEEYAAIRRAWVTHVAAEECLFVPHAAADWQAQMGTMLSVFSDNCVMELVPTGERWEGRAQAEAFYRIFIPSFAEMAWVPQAVVVGPRGVLDVVNMTGILRQPFAGLTTFGQPVQL